MSNATATDFHASAGHIFSSSGHSSDHELIETLASNTDLRIERIVSYGQSSPEGFWYDQDEDEWVLLLSGAASIAFEHDDKPQQLQPGDYLLIPARKRHRVTWTSPQQPTVWLAIFSTTAIISANKPTL